MPDMLQRNSAEVHEQTDPRDVFAGISPSYDIQKAAKPYRSQDPGYYGLPILKRPFWKWEIALYFFFEGVSGSAYVLSAMAELVDRRRFAGPIRSARLFSFLTMIVCPPLLIIDLGRPERFHHMLRIWKRTSPMNHGAWALTGYGSIVSFLALLGVSPRSASTESLASALKFLRRWAPERLISTLGIPFALTMVSYPGVLLETTANPIWSRSNFLGPLFAASSMSAGASALTLLNYRCRDHGLHRVLSRFEDVAAIAETTALIAYLASAGKAARLLWKGKQSTLFQLGAVGLGLLLPAFLRHSRSKILRELMAPIAALAGSAALKWSITYAGQESSLDPEMASFTGKTVHGEAYWGPKNAEATQVPATREALASL